MARQGHRGVPTSGGDPRDVASRLNNLLRGKINSVDDLTLSTGTSSTAVTDVNVGAESCILFMPTTAAAAAELVSGNMYVSATDTQTFTVEHGTSGTASSRTFVYVVLG